MNHYTLADMKPGLTESFTVTVTQEMMDQFLAITGDCSPIHVDADYAKGRGYPGCVVYGMLGASFFSTLAGVYLPGEHCLLHGVECKFARPIFVGDTLTVTGTVADVSEAVAEAEIKAVITNQDGKLVAAVTHVFVNDHTRGYGIFAENMQETALSLEIRSAA